MSIKILVNGRKHTVRVSNVRGFCTSASVRIGGKLYESRDRPYGFVASAIDDVVSRVRAVYPAAREVDSAGIR